MSHASQNLAKSVELFGQDGNGSTIQPAVRLSVMFMSTRLRSLYSHITYFRRKDGHVWMHVHEGLLMAVVSKLVADHHCIYKRLDLSMVLDLLCIARPALSQAQPTGQNLGLADEFFNGWNAGNTWCLSVPLFAQPARVVDLSAGQPRVDQDVEIDATAAFGCGDRPWNAQ